TIRPECAAYSTFKPGRDPANRNRRSSRVRYRCRQRDERRAMSSVLIVRPSSLGDIVHALPVVHDIRQHRAGMSIDWVAEEAFVELVALNREVRAIIPVSLRQWRAALLARATWREVGSFRSALRAQRYDVVLDFQEQVNGALISWLARGAVHGP